MDFLLELDAGDGESTSREKLDRTAENMRLRATVRRNGTLAVQFSVPTHLIPPDGQEEIIIDDQDAMPS